MSAFRWSLARREQLGRLIDHVEGYVPPNQAFLRQLRATSAAVLALSDGADLVFVGRTPENFFDYLSGAFDGVSGAPALTLLPFSMRWPGPGGLGPRAVNRNRFSAGRRLSFLKTRATFGRSADSSLSPSALDGLSPAQRDGVFTHLEAHGLAPDDIASAPAPIGLVDFVAEGGTFENLLGLMRLHAARDGVDWNAVQRRLRLIGLRHREKNSPNTWRWQQHQPWLDDLPDLVVKNVSVPPGFLILIANFQHKVTHPFTPERWLERWAGTGGRSRPATNDQRKALAFAAALYDHGASRAERRALASTIARRQEMRQPATRALVLALKRAGGS